MLTFSHGYLIVIILQVRSYMPSRVKQILPSFCKDMFCILDSLNFNSPIEDGPTIRLKIAKRCLIIFCALVTRHRKHADKYVLWPLLFFFSSIFSILPMRLCSNIFFKTYALMFSARCHILSTVQSKYRNKAFT